MLYTMFKIKHLIEKVSFDSAFYFGFLSLDTTQAQEKVTHFQNDLLIGVYVLFLEQEH